MASSRKSPLDVAQVGRELVASASPGLPSVIRAEKFAGVCCGTEAFADAGPNGASINLLIDHPQFAAVPNRGKWRLANIPQRPPVDTILPRGGYLRV